MRGVVATRKQAKLRHDEMIARQAKADLVRELFGKGSRDVRAAYLKKIQSTPEFTSDLDKMKSMLNVPPKRIDLRSKTNLSITKKEFDSEWL